MKRIVTIVTGGFALVALHLWLAPSADACTTPDTNSKPGQVAPDTAPAPDSGSGEEGATPAPSNPGPAEPGGADPGGADPGGTDTGAPESALSLTEADHLQLSFTAGYDKDADPNAGYFNHPHKAFTEVSVINDATGEVVVTQMVPVWDYDAADQKSQTSYEKLETLRIAPLPAGQYSFVTKAVFELHDKTIEGTPATRTFSVDSYIPPTPAPDSPAAEQPAPATSDVETSPRVTELTGGCQIGAADASGTSAAILLLLLGLVAIRRSAR